VWENIIYQEMIIVRHLYITPKSDSEQEFTYKHFQNRGICRIMYNLVSINAS